MATYDYRPGLGNGASYEVSGIPWVKHVDPGSAGDIAISFPLVTRWIIVSNSDPVAANIVRVGFSANGVDGENYYLLSGSQTTPRLEVKTTELHLKGNSNQVTVIAGLTGIATVNIDNTNVSPSGSNWSGSLSAQVG
tara:strand:- start:186 stop:596 length:411 start_codon:yes stop_codon:yes gene_type:complete